MLVLEKDVLKLPASSFDLDLGRDFEIRRTDANFLCTFHVPPLKFAKELEIRNYEHLKNAYSKKLKIWAGSNKKILFFTKIFGKLEIENYDKTQLNLLIMKR